MPPFVPIVKILKKIGVTGKIWEKARVKPLMDLTKCQFQYFGNFQCQLFSIFDEEDQ